MRTTANRKMNLTKEQLNNLLVFLDRTQLNGKETRVMVELQMILSEELQKLTPDAPKDAPKSKAGSKGSENIDG